MKKVGFHTLGCKVNQYETESMEEEFIKNGYEIVDFDDPADVYVINTCTVTNISDRKSRQFIRRAKRKNPDSVVAVVGCYSQVAPDEIEEIEDVDVILGTSNRMRLVELCEEASEKGERINIVDEIKYERDFEDISIYNMEDQTRAYIKIQDGCNQFCSYCIIPYARGPIRSRELEDIINEVKNLVDQGFKEVVLTGIHVASYGKDLKDERALMNLVTELSKIKGLERIRFSSLEPRLIDREFLETLVDSKKACDHFHLSLQSGSNSVLDRMNRKYTSEEYYEKVELIREYMPDAGITTDIIVGFPGETEEEFQETMDFVKKLSFSRIHVFKYSPRKGTPAAEMKNQIDGNIKNDRSDLLIELGSRLEREFMKSFIGEEVDVLFEEIYDDKSNQMEGYTTNYMRVRTDYNEELAGRIEKVKLSSIEDEVLIASLEGGL